MKFQVFTNEDSGIKGIVPENWKELNKGEFYRSSSADDRTVLVQLGISGFTDEQLKVILSPKLNLEAFPNSIGGIKTKFFSWDFYKTEYQEQNLETLMVDIALTHDDNGAYVVLLQALPEEHDDLYYSIFLRAVDVLEPLSKNQFKRSNPEDDAKNDGNHPNPRRIEAQCPEQYCPHFLPLKTLLAIF